MTAPFPRGRLSVHRIAWLCAALTAVQLGAGCAGGEAGPEDVGLNPQPLPPVKDPDDKKEPTTAPPPESDYGAASSSGASSSGSGTNPMPNQDAGGG